MHWGINIPSKLPPPFFLPTPSLNLQIVQAIPFWAIPLSMLAISEHPPSLKVGFFSKPPKYYRFPSLTSSYPLKVPKFLVKISQYDREKYFCL